MSSKRNSMAVFRLLVGALLIVIASMAGISANAQYVCGDIDGDGAITYGGDFAKLVFHVYFDSTLPEPYLAGNVDGCGWVDIGDLEALGCYLFYIIQPPLDCENTTDCRQVVPGNDVLIGLPPYYIYPGGDSIAVPIRINNTIPLSTVSLGLRYSGTGEIEATSWSLDSSLISSGGGGFRFYPDNDMVWFGWNNATPLGAIPPQFGGLLATLNFRIVSGPSDQTISIDTAFVPSDRTTFFVGTCENQLHILPQVNTVAGTDVLFLLDVTGSTGQLLPQWRQKIPEIAARWQSGFPGTRFAIATHADFPFLPYGGDGEWAYRREVDFTTNISALETALDSITNQWGADTPESQYEALYQVLTGEGRDLDGDGFYTSPGEIPPQPLSQAHPMVIYFCTWPPEYHDRDVEPDYPYPGSLPVCGYSLLSSTVTAKRYSHMLIWIKPVNGPLVGQSKGGAALAQDPLENLVAMTGGAVYAAGESLGVLLDVVDSSLALWEMSEQVVSDSDSDGVANYQDNCILAYNPSQTDSDSDGLGDVCDCCLFQRGDVNGDGDEINIIDLTFIVDFIFRSSGDPGPCPEESDVNADGSSLNILDLTFAVDYIFRSGPPPPACP